MEKERGSKVIAIVALLIAVVGLSLGFAAFTKDLNITFAESNVKVSGDLDIKFLASADPEDTSTTVTVSSVSNATSVNPATISTDGLTISGIGGTFSDKGQYAYYDFYIYNNSEYDAYLKAIDFLNYTGAETNKVCTALEGTTQSLVDAACEDIVVGIAMDADGDGNYEVEVVDTSASGFTSVKIPKGEIISVMIAIIYFEDSSSAILPNGDFKINFGGIKFSFSSLEG